MGKIRITTKRKGTRAEYHQFTNQLAKLKEMVSKIEENWKNWKFTDECEPNDSETDLQISTARLSEKDGS